MLFGVSKGCSNSQPLGSGNHFAELQIDGEGRLWLMVHSGSRAMGPAIRDHHLERAPVMGSSGLRALDANSAEGCAYLHDTAWARRYAVANRQQIAMNIGTVLTAIIGATLQWDLAITTDHNHVESEPHSGSRFWVHRKGAMAAAHDQWGALPGSMGTASFHVHGRGCSQALCSRYPRCRPCSAGTCQNSTRVAASAKLQRLAGRGVVLAGHFI